MPAKEIISIVDGRKLKLTNVDKVLYPTSQVVKAELIQYYLSVAEHMLPFVKDRPMTLIRYPDGIDKGRFYSKNTPAWAPDWVHTVQLDPDDDNIYSIAQDKPTLAWMANLAALEFHSMTVNLKKNAKPDHFIIDLDPPASASFDLVKDIARQLKPFLEDYGYQPYLKTSGSSGLHIYVPIIPTNDQSVVVEAVRALAKRFVKGHKETTLELSKEKRKGRVLIDIFRNNKSQTCVAPYSTRGKVGCPISTPLHWSELDDLSSSQQYTIHTILDRLQAVSDPWTDFYTTASTLTGVIKAASKKQVAAKVAPSVEENVPLDPIPDLAEMTAPMLAVAATGSGIPSRELYTYEIKWDGIRVIVVKQGQEISIQSRAGNNLTEKFPKIVAACRELNATNIIVDGEIVALDSNGQPHFGKTVGRMHLQGSKAIERASKKSKTVLYVFDLLYINTKDMRQQPLETRREALADAVAEDNHLRYSANFDDGEALFAAVEARGMEGIMCKRKGSLYVSGRRSKDWTKVKVRNQDDAYIIGYTEGRGDRSGLFGSLHLAKKDPDGWVYKGRVGTGFSQDRLRAVYKQLAALPASPKLILDSVEEEHKTTWIAPLYIATIKYASETPNGHYREPVFIELRESVE